MDILCSVVVSGPGILFELTHNPALQMKKEISFCGIWIAERKYRTFLVLSMARSSHLPGSQRLKAMSQSLHLGALMGPSKFTGDRMSVYVMPMLYVTKSSRSSSSIVTLRADFVQTRPRKSGRTHRVRSHS
jgi:hypothetical protein